MYGLSASISTSTSARAVSRSPTQHVATAVSASWSGSRPTARAPAWTSSVTNVAMYSAGTAVRGRNSRWDPRITVVPDERLGTSRQAVVEVYAVLGAQRAQEIVAAVENPRHRPEHGKLASLLRAASGIAECLELRAGGFGVGMP